MRILISFLKQMNSGTPKTEANRSDRSRPGRLLVAAICICALISAAGLFTAAQAQSMEEHEAKAALLFKILTFVKWPSDANRELVIGFVGADPTSYAMQRLVGDKTVNGKPVVVRRLEADSDLKSVQALYIGASQAKNISSLLERVRGGSVLTVGEVEGFGQHGGVVNLLLNNGKMRFEVNPNSAERAHLQVSSRILSLATLVSDGS
jgi:hypothetical protein